jgi:hypothetical protein
MIRIASLRLSERARWAELCPSITWSTAPACYLQGGQNQGFIQYAYVAQPGPEIDAPSSHAG